MDFLKLSKLEILTCLESLIDEYECDRRANPELHSLLVKLRKLIVYGDPNDKTFDRNIAKTYGQCYDTSDSSEDDDDDRDHYDNLQSYFASSLTSLPTAKESYAPNNTMFARSNVRSDTSPFVQSREHNGNSDIRDYASVNYVSHVTDDSDAVTCSNSASQSSTSHTFPPPRHFAMSARVVPHSSSTQIHRPHNPYSSIFAQSPSTSPVRTKTSRTETRNDPSQEKSLKRDWRPPASVRQVKPEPPSDSDCSSDFSDSGHHSLGLKDQDQVRRGNHNQDHDQDHGQSENSILAAFDKLCHRCYNPGHIVKECHLSREEGKIMGKVYFLKHPEVKAAISKRKKDAIQNDPVRRERKSRNTRMRLQRRRMKLMNAERMSTMLNGHLTSNQYSNTTSSRLFGIGTEPHVSRAQASFTLTQPRVHQESHVVHFHNPVPTVWTPSSDMDTDNRTEYQSPIDHVMTIARNVVAGIGAVIVGTTLNSAVRTSTSPTTTTAPSISTSTSGEIQTKFCFNCRTQGHLKVECPFPKSYGNQLKKLYYLEHPEKKNRNKKRKQPGVHPNPNANASANVFGTQPQGIFTLGRFYDPFQD